MEGRPWAPSGEKRETEKVVAQTVPPLSKVPVERTSKAAAKMVADDPEVAAMVSRELTGKHGGDRKSEQAKEIKSDNVTLDPPDRGNSRSYTLRRLERERPDLFKRDC
jgi:hypothetical protein